MKRLEVLDLFEVGAKVGVLQSHLVGENVRGGTIYIAMSQAMAAVRKFESEHKAFRLATEAATKLAAKIRANLDANFFETVGGEKKFKSDINFATDMPTWYFYDLKSTIEEFNHVFAAECGKCETYFIEQKLGFDVSTMLHDAEKNIHANILGFVSSAAIDEIKHAGRCFAVENYTASGFHVLRALEVVMGDYYKQVSEKDRHLEAGTTT